MMKQVIPFIKEIVFEEGLGSVVSISLEHDYLVDNNEINGNFYVYGEYKKKLDSSEIFDFREKIDFNLLIPDNMIQDTVNIDIDDFAYEVLEGNRIKVCIYLSLYGEEIKIRDKDDVRELDEIYEINNVNVDIDNVTNNIEEYISNDVSNVVDDVNVSNEVEVSNEVTEIGEYVIYHIHIVNEGDTLESIINKYDTNIDILKEYNDVSKLDIGTKLVIPEVYYGIN